MNQPTDALLTIENAGELILRGINAERAKLKIADKALEDFYASVEKHLSFIREARNGTPNADNRRDNYPSISGPAPSAGEIYRGRVSDLS